MPTQAVAFETINEPSMTPNPDAANCYLFTWDVLFFVTQNSGTNLTRSARSGHVLQRVDIAKAVFTCDNQPDSGSWDFRSLVESFRIRDEGVDPETNTDAVQIGFPKNRRTQASVTLEAAYRPDLSGLTILQQFADPSQNVSGADAILRAAPADFAPTLTRTINVYADCCGPAALFFIETRAYNSFGTYSEVFRLNFREERGTRAKRVNGRLVESQ
jgi:hypothetical protein